MEIPQKFKIDPPIFAYLPDERKKKKKLTQKDMLFIEVLL